MTGNMAENAKNGGGRRRRLWRIAPWAIAALLLLAPLVAMQFTHAVAWDLGDFIVAGVLLLGAGLAYELLARKSGNGAYRTAAGIAVAAGLLLIWMNLAVGIIGDEGNPVNLMYIGVLSVGAIGAILARFQPDGMARALFAMALAQALVGVIALASRLGSTGSIWPADILGLTGFFVALFIGSGLLFQKAAREQSPAGDRAAG